MTVYELIQELAQYKADADVLVSFESEDKYGNCANCGEEFKVDGDDITASDYSVRQIGHRIYIEAEE